ncbi:MAG TPA: Trm112 family protein [Kineosporiaceae bacterium]|nr:Trm112 family protein [Kineosporiaceae bacterium]
MSAIDSWLREILRCPSCRSTLRDATGPGGAPELACTGCSLAYRIDDGIPVLLVEEARDRDADGVHGAGPAGQ